MPKPKLSQQQKRRLQKTQTLRQSHTGTGSSDELQYTSKGRIISHFGKQVELEELSQDTQGQAHAIDANTPSTYRCHLRMHLGAITVGDQVSWHKPSDGSKTGVVGAILPRTSLLARPDARGQQKPIAANIDQVLCVFAVYPEASSLLIDSYLVACELNGISPILVANKVDLMDERSEAEINALIDRYRKIGYQVLSTSCKRADGLTELKAALANKSSVFVGQSGVGKSSLINALLPDAGLRVGALSEGTQLGTHTTTASRLFHLPSGGSLIDSPGVREFGLWNVDPDILIDGYPELRDLAGQCRFRNCSHQHEPDCALQRAYQSGDMDDVRFQNYLHLLSNISEL